MPVPKPVPASAPQPVPGSSVVASTMDASLALEFRQTRKSFGNFEALRGLDLQVKRGEVYGLLGPNGAGKTTAIRILCGLEKATSGSVSCLGKRVPDESLRSRLGYMPQEEALYADLTVRENLEFFGTLFGVDEDELDGRIQPLLKFVGLTPWQDAVITTLSGGMRHRASLAASLLHGPELLVLDEPTVGVDPQLRAAFWEYFHGLAEDGVTVLITTHYMDEARNCSRIGLMTNGRLVAEGAPGDVVRRSGERDLEAAFLKYAREAKESTELTVPRASPAPQGRGPGSPRSSLPKGTWSTGARRPEEGDR